jgi:hypothetical protein
MVLLAPRVEFRGAAGCRIGKMVGQVKLATDGSIGRTVREVLERVRLVLIEGPITPLDDHFRNGGFVP